MNAALAERPDVYRQRLRRRGDGETSEAAEADARLSCWALARPCQSRRVAVRANGATAGQPANAVDVAGWPGQKGTASCLSSEVHLSEGGRRGVIYWEYTRSF